MFIEIHVSYQFAESVYRYRFFTPKQKKLLLPDWKIFWRHIFTSSVFKAWNLSHRKRRHRSTLYTFFTLYFKTLCPMVVSDRARREEEKPSAEREGEEVTTKYNFPLVTLSHDSIHHRRSPASHRRFLCVRSSPIIVCTCVRESDQFSSFQNRILWITWKRWIALPTWSHFSITHTCTHTEKNRDDGEARERCCCHDRVTARA